jgi:hypothetical protein
VLPARKISALRIPRSAFAILFSSLARPWKSATSSRMKLLAALAVLTFCAAVIPARAQDPAQEKADTEQNGRGIYSHGTPVERLIGRAASYGCIRMCSRDVVRLFDAAPVGARIDVVNAPLHRVIAEASMSHHLRNGHLAVN